MKHLEELNKAVDNIVDKGTIEEVESSFLVLADKITECLLR